MAYKLFAVLVLVLLTSRSILFNPPWSIYPSITASQLCCRRCLTVHRIHVMAMCGMADEALSDHNHARDQCKDDGGAIVGVFCDDIRDWERQHNGCAQLDAIQCHGQTVGLVDVRMHHQTGDCVGL